MTLLNKDTLANFEARSFELAVATKERVALIEGLQELKVLFEQKSDAIATTFMQNDVANNVDDQTMWELRALGEGIDNQVDNAIHERPLIPNGTYYVLTYSDNDMALNIMKTSMIKTNVSKLSSYDPKLKPNFTLHTWIEGERVNAEQWDVQSQRWVSLTASATISPDIHSV